MLMVLRKSIGGALYCYVFPLTAFVSLDLTTKFFGWVPLPGSLLDTLIVTMRSVFRGPIGDVALLLCVVHIFLEKPRLWSGRSQQSAPTRVS